MYALAVEDAILGDRASHFQWDPGPISVLISRQKIDFVT